MFSFSKIFKYLWQILKPHRIGFLLMALIAPGRIFFTLMLIPFCYKSIIDILNTSAISIDTRYDLAILFVLPMSLAYISSITITRYREYVNARLISAGVKDIYDFSFSKLANHSYKFYADNFSGSLVAKVKRFIRAFEVIHTTFFQSFWFLSVLITGSTVMLYFESKILALYLAIWCIVYFFVVILFVKQKIKLDLIESHADSQVTGVLSDSITNVVNVKIFSAFEKEFTYFRKITTFVKECMYNAFKFNLVRSALQAVLMIIFHIFILYTMINLWKAGEITVGVFVMTYMYIFTIMERIWDLSDGITNFMKGMTDIKEVVDIFETEIEVKDPINPEACRIQDGVIEFNNVYFGYNDEDNVLEKFDLKINKGEKIGIVGHSGSGKSTITKILLRFSDVHNGEITIDGQNIMNITQDDLRKNISYVPQESILFHRSIKENIAYSKDNPTDEEIIQASKFANADAFIDGLPSKYDTLVGERGVKLSGGERQRVAIARAMLKNSPILVLDEATSSLDSISEEYIQESFAKLMEGRTTIVIAHRLSTIQKMDRIIVLDKGKIVEEGTHKELLKKQGVYADLWNHQVGGFIE